MPVIISETPNMVDTDRFQPTHKPISPSALSRGSSGITMSAHPSLDRESFQTLLASAFAAQESGMNKQSFSVLIELQSPSGSLAYGSKGPSDRSRDSQVILRCTSGRPAVIVLVKVEIPVEIAD